MYIYVLLLPLSSHNTFLHEKVDFHAQLSMRQNQYYSYYASAAWMSITWQQWELQKACYVGRWASCEKSNFKISKLFSSRVKASWNPEHTAKNNPALVFLSFTFLPKPCLHVFSSFAPVSLRKEPIASVFPWQRGNRGSPRSEWEHLELSWEVAMLLLDISLQTLPPAWHWLDKLSPDVVVNHFWGRTSNKIWSSVPAFDDEEWNMSW